MRGKAQGKEGEGVPGGEQENAVGEENGQRQFVSATNTEEQVLEWDREGKFLIFEHEKGRFLEMRPETVRELSKGSRTAYFVSKAMWEREKGGEEDPIFSIGPTSEGRLGDQYSGTVVRNGLVVGFCRKDNLYKRLQEGCRIAKPEDVLATSAFKVEGHFETKDSKTGAMDQVMIVIGKEQKRENQKRRERQHNQIVGERKAQMRESARETDPRARLADD